MRFAKRRNKRLQESNRDNEIGMGSDIWHHLGSKVGTLLNRDRSGDLCMKENKPTIATSTN